MLRITTTDERPLTVSFKVEGRIVSDWIQELEQECRRFLERGKNVSLEFSGVTFIDGQAAAMLKSFLTQNVEVINCSALIKGLLTEEQV